VTLGGLVGAVGVLGLLYALPVIGTQPIDVPGALGGVVTSNARAAFWIGAAIFLLVAIIVWPAATTAAWPMLPGSNVGFMGAAQKGIVAGAAIWIVSGVALGVASWLTRAVFANAPGLFALNAGLAGALSLFVACVLHGLAIALVGAMEAAVSTFELLGWTHYYHAAGGPRVLGAHRSPPEDLLQELGGGV
jgi:hypothetical protein